MDVHFLCLFQYGGLFGTSPACSLYYAQLPAELPFQFVATGATYRQNEVRYIFVKIQFINEVLYADCGDNMNNGSPCVM